MRSFKVAKAVAAFTVATSPKKSLRTTPSSPSTSSQHLLTLSQLQQPPLQQLQQHQRQQQQLSTATVSSYCLEKMCQLLKVEPGDNIYLSTIQHDDGNVNSYNRGLHVKTAVKEGEVLLSIPIASCFRDDEPPGWFHHQQQEQLNDINSFDNSSNRNNHYNNNNNNNINLDEELHITDYERYNPSAWSARLAASILDMELHQEKMMTMSVGRVLEDDEKNLMLGREMWRSTLPDMDMLRASLPVHWDEDVLAAAKCTALELAVDSAYFARANAVSNLSENLWDAMLNAKEDEIILERKCNDVVDIALGMETLQRKCHDALDIVQTRACRVERTGEGGVQWGPPLRIVAPIFDFINHGSSLFDGEGCANACFGIKNEHMCDLQEARLVVRATRDVMEGEEILIDYGDSARPNWRCLTSYGFVPDHDINSNVVDEDQSRDVAELWMNGLRFEVDTQSVPYDLVEVAAAQVLLDQDLEDNLDDQQQDDEDEEVGYVNEEGLVLSPPVARAIAKRAKEAAFNLILEPDVDNSEEEAWDDPEFVHAMNLAALLRWSQHKVLMAFAENLALFAESPTEAEQ